MFSYKLSKNMTESPEFFKLDEWDAFAGFVVDFVDIEFVNDAFNGESDRNVNDVVDDENVHNVPP
jgi:hypothetical protein